MNVPDSPKKYTMAYENLKGVDLSKDQTEVDRYHSPDMLNMISDEGGNPVKRIGWRSIIDSGNIIDFLIRTENGQEERGRPRASSRAVEKVHRLFRQPA